ncbi:hypothetical protein D3C79_909480 [compost metagenome]
MFVGLSPQHQFQFTSQLKHLLGIGQCLPPGLRQLKLPANPAEQLNAIGLFEQRYLPADGLGCQVQLLAGAHDAACLGHHPEVMQLSIVEHGNQQFVKTEV